MPDKNARTPNEVAATPKTERIKKQIMDRGFAEPVLVGKFPKQWCTYPLVHGKADLNQPIKGPYIGDLLEEVSKLTNVNGTELPKTKLKAVPAAAPAKVEEPEEKEEEPTPQETKGDGLDQVVLDHDPGTGQQYVPGVEPSIPRRLAELVQDEFKKKKASTSANNEFQEAKKKRDEEAAKPIYGHLFKPDPKHPKKSYLIAGHVKLERNVSETVTFKSVAVKEEDMEESGSRAAEAAA